MKNWLVEKCRKSEAFSWGMFGIGIVIMLIIALM
jgi:hypothetical protein